MNVLRFTQVTCQARAVLKVLAISVPILAIQAVAPILLKPFGFSFAQGVAVAQEEEKPQGEKETVKRTQALDNRLYEKLQAAQKAIEEKKYNEALSILNDVTKDKKRNDYEMANILNLYAFVYYTQENYPKALDAYKKIIALEKAPDGTKNQARYSLAQMYFVTEQYKEAVAALKEWFKVTPEPGASAYMLMAQGCYQLKDMDCALKNVETAINMYKERGKVPAENWYGLQRYLYYEKENYKKVVDILNEMLKHYPKKQYWVQLSAMYGELKDPLRQMTAMETAYVQDMLTDEAELIQMAYLYLANEVPYKAAKVLDKGISNKRIQPNAKNLELLGNAWRAAQEVKKAIPEMARAAEKSDKGDLWARLCNIYLDNDEYQAAVESCEKGLKKGGVKRPDTAYLVKGMAHFNLKQYSAARAAFKEAAKDKRSETYAKQWLQFMESELKRQQSLEQG